jgi:hypothetical protein
MTKHYRCSLLDVDRVVCAVVITANDDAGALLEAEKILAASSYTAAEVWRGVRKVSLISRAETAA